MRNSRGFTSAAAFGCLLVAAFMMPALAQAQAEFEGETRLFGAPAWVPDPDAPEGFLREGRSTNMFLVDGANGGTIYWYNYELQQIIKTCPTPEPADGVTADGLAYAGDRGTLFYTNANGSGLIYEIDPADCSVLQSFPASAACGGCTNVPGLGYGDDLGGVSGLFLGSLDTAIIFTTDPDVPAVRNQQTILAAAFGVGGFIGSIGADLDGNTNIFVQDYYPDIDNFRLQASPNWADWWDTNENLLMGGLGMVSRRTDPFDPTARQDRTYNSLLAPNDALYEYDAENRGQGDPFRPTLAVLPDPTPGAQVSAVAVGDLDSDFDGIIDLEDTCPGVRSSDTTDGDGDGVFDHCDNCPVDANAGQEDRDLDGDGDACDFAYTPPPLPDKLVYLVDGFEGGTIYEYDAVAGLILREFATPELNLGTGQGLAYSQRRGSLFYTNATGPQPTIYELTLSDGSVLASSTWNPVCVGGANDGQTCDNSGTKDCPDGTCDGGGISVRAQVPEGLGIGQLGNFPAGGFNWGGAPLLYSLGVDTGGFGRFYWNDPNLAGLVSTSAPGFVQGQAAMAATEDTTDEIPASDQVCAAFFGVSCVDGIGYFTDGNGGTNQMEAISANPFSFIGFAEWTIADPSAADQLGMGFDGRTFYMSRAGVDGLFQYDVYDYFFTSFDAFIGGSGIQNQACTGGVNAGAVCRGSVAQTGCDPGTDPFCCDGGTCDSTAPFIADPTPGGPITAVAAGAADVDLDGAPNNVDVCPTVFDPAQNDSDLDGFGDACDNCPGISNPGQEESELLNKFDGVGDVCDNCPFLFNPGQEDDDGNGVGNVCDPPPGFVDDSDADDQTFGPDDPAIPRAIDIAQFETSVDFCDFSCVGGADVCCGQSFDTGDAALIVEMSVLGEASTPRIVSGFYDVFFDYGEGDSCTGLSIKDAELEPGVCEDTSDIRMSARFAQSTGRARVEPNFQANLNLNNDLNKLSTVNQVDGVISYVLPVASLIDKADADQAAASGLDTDPPGEVEYALWAKAESQTVNVDRAPNTDDNGVPTIADEVTVYTAFFNQVDVDYPGFPQPKSFDGTNVCWGGDGDRVVLGGGTASSFITLVNPSFQPMTLTDIVVTDPQFEVPLSLPVTLDPLGGSLATTVRFTPSSLGPQSTDVTLISSDPTPLTFQMTGTGLANDPPVVSTCTVNPTSVPTNSLVILTAAYSDSATDANVSTCSAVGIRQPPDSFRQVIIPLNDAGSGFDVACDGTVTGFGFTAGLFGSGTWEFTVSCQDRQGNLTVGGACTLVVN